MEEAEVERLRRLAAADEILPTLTGVLDIRAVFGRLSAIAQRVLPHDALGLPVISDDRQAVIPYALTGALADGDVPTRVPIPPELHQLLAQDWDFRIFDDIQTEPSFRHTPPFAKGYRSSLVVPVRIHGTTEAVLNFLSYTPSRYQPADFVYARRIADYVALALSHERLSEAAARAAEERERAAALESRVRQLSRELASLTPHHRAVGESPAWQNVLRQATQVAPTDTTVLLFGESGTGKEVVARYVHRASRRRDGPFVALNGAALPDQLLESELFGYERGAFTGATHSKAGHLELAAGGTLLLDEVGELSASAQAKLLRVLETREFQRLGGTRTLRADVRLLAATNRDLRSAIERGTFREDLYYRLNVFAIELAPLRERRTDILVLSEAFLEDLGRTLGRPPAGISVDGREALIAHDWPGNVRELRNALERAAILCEGGLITAAHLSFPRANATAAAPPTPSHTAHVDGANPTPASLDLWSVERELIKQALDAAQFNKSKAARSLGLTRTQLYVRLRRYGLA